MKERDYEKDEKGRLPGCRNIGCFFLLIIAALVIFCFYVVLSKPKSLWNPLVDFLNAEVELKDENKLTFLESKSIVEEKINDNHAEVKIPENALTALTQESFDSFKNINVQIEEGRMFVYFVLDDSIPENPLYGVVVVKINEAQNLEIEKVGTPKVGIPKQINKALVNSALAYLTLGEKLEEENLIYKLLASKNSFKAEKIEFQQDNLVLKNITFDLYQE